MNHINWSLLSAGRTHSFELDVSAIPHDALQKLVMAALWVDAEYGIGNVNAEDESPFEALHEACKRAEAFAVMVSDKAT